VELSSSDDEMINRMVNISSFTKGEDVLQSFPCNELKDGYSTPRCVESLHGFIMVILFSLSEYCKILCVGLGREIIVSYRYLRVAFLTTFIYNGIVMSLWYATQI